MCIRFFIAIWVGYRELTYLMLGHVIRLVVVQILSIGASRMTGQCKFLSKMKLGLACRLCILGKPVHFYIYHLLWKIIKKFNALGFDKSLLRRCHAVGQMVLEQASQPPPAVPPLKEFKPKMALPKLADYKKPPPAGFWNHWPKRTFEQTALAKSWVSSGRLKELAKTYGYMDWARLDRVVQRLDHG